MEIIQTTTNKWSYMVKPREDQMKSGNIEYYYTEDRRTFVLPTLINNEPEWVRIGMLESSNKTTFTQVSDLLDAIYSDDNTLQRQSDFSRFEIEELIRMNEESKIDIKENKTLTIYFNGTFDPINFNHMEIAERLINFYKKSYTRVAFYFVLDKNTEPADGHKPNKTTAELRAKIILDVIQSGVVTVKSDVFSFVYNEFVYSYDFIKNAVKAAKDNNDDCVFVFGQDNYEQMAAGKWTLGEELLKEFGHKLEIISLDNKEVIFDKDQDILFSKDAITNVNHCYLRERVHYSLSSTFIRSIANQYHNIRIICESLNHMLSLNHLKEYEIIKKIAEYKVLHTYNTDDEIVRSKYNISRSVDELLDKNCFKEVVKFIKEDKLYYNAEKYLGKYPLDIVFIAVKSLRDFFSKLKGYDDMISELDEILKLDVQKSPEKNAGLPEPQMSLGDGPKLVIVKDYIDLKRTLPGNKADIAIYDYAEGVIKAVLVRQSSGKFEESILLSKKDVMRDNLVTYASVKEAIDKIIKSKENTLMRVTKEDVEMGNSLSMALATIVYYVEDVAGIGCSKENMAHFYIRDIGGSFKYKCTLPTYAYAGGFTYENVSKYMEYMDNYITSEPSEENPFVKVWNNKEHLANHSSEKKFNLIPSKLCERPDNWKELAEERKERVKSITSRWMLLPEDNKEVIQDEPELEEYKPFDIETEMINGQPYTYISESNMVAGIVYVKDTHEILLTTQKRPYAKYSIEPAGGKIDEGESAMSAMIREAEEELALDLSKSDIMYISEVNCAPGLFTSMTFLYLITVPSLKDSNHREQDEDEYVERYLVRRDKFVEIFEAGGYQDVRIQAMMSNKVVRMMMEID